MQILSLATTLILLALSSVPVARTGKLPDDSQRVVRRSVDLGSVINQLDDNEVIKLSSTSFINEPLVEVEQSQNLFNRLGELVRNALAPPRFYIDLIVRYRKWLKQYKELQARDPELSRDGLELIKEEYTNVDREFSQQECERARQLRQEQIELARNEGMPFEDNGGPLDESRTENVDFMFKVLAEVINRLELRIGAHNNPGLTNALDDPVDPLSYDITDDHLIDESIEKIKRTAIKAAKEAVSREFNNMALVAGFHVASIAISNVAGIPPELQAVLNIIVGTPSLSVATKYLRDIKFRTALTLVSSLNPSECKLNPRVGSTTSSVFERKN